MLKHEWKALDPLENGVYRWQCQGCLKIGESLGPVMPEVWLECPGAGVNHLTTVLPLGATVGSESDSKPARRKEDSQEAVNHPAHYTPGPYEVYRVLIAWGIHGDALLWDAMIYLARCKKKGNELEDIRKAIKWLGFKVDLMMGKDPTDPMEIQRAKDEMEGRPEGYPKGRDLDAARYVRHEVLSELTSRVGRVCEKGPVGDSQYIPVWALQQVINDLDSRHPGTNPETQREALRLEGYAAALDDVLGAPGPVVNIHSAFGTSYVLYTQLLERLNHLRTMQGIPVK
jgi:hypothetical protein